MKPAQTSELIPQCRCALCGSVASPLHRRLPDIQVRSPGVWDVLRCGNPACEMLTLEPRPSTEELKQAYQDYYTHDEGVPVPQARGVRRRARSAIQQRLLGYPHTNGGTDVLLGYLYALSPARREIALREMFYVHYVAGGRLLEVGCGNGRQLERLAQAGWQVEGIDFDEHAASAARRLGIPVRVGELSSADYADDQFDAIILSHVIEHVEDPVRLLAECRRILKPGGQLILATPNANALGHRWYGRAWLGLEPPRHLVVFTPRALADAARRAGIERVSIQTKSIVGAWWFLASVWRRSALGDDSRAPLPNGSEYLPLRLRFMALFERLVCALGRDVGEEILLEARK
jgi:2-polyprenyl-3-methyl-5-hydroxy-6-metoxy-1,4-benzoquinol methylase